DKMDRLQLEEEIFKTLDILEENVSRADAVIERLSSFAKKPRELKIEAVDLKKAAEMALSFLEAELNYYNIKVEKAFAEDLPLIRADLHILEDVFLNLLVNARQAVEQNGKITVGGRVQDGELEVVVQDTGVGIPKENLDKIFDPFFTTKFVSQDSEHRPMKGSHLGLGLFIVREFIQRFGGRIAVHSEIGKGTTFCIFFPSSVWMKP
ncbi:MAG: ATP-binding protein, partial [Candidatus Omnitrophica bacterium]|nr:ATP-binding protein [Candidatus Omnitrophota bacterium]